MMRKIALCCLLFVTFTIPSLSQENAGTSGGAQSSRPRRIRVSSGVLGAFLEKSAKPLYPEQAVRAGIKGDVILQVEVDETGRVVRSLAIEGDPLLVAASVEALKDFRFRPYLLNGEPVSVEGQMGFRFVLKGEGDKAQGAADYTSDVPFRPEFRTGAVTDRGVLVLSPRKISGPDPLLLPELAGKSGSVYLTVTVGADGKVEDVKVVGGDEPFVGPVVAAVKQDVFEPQLVDGKPSSATVQEAFHFGSSRN
jgi:TonB family protein